MKRYIFRKQVGQRGCCVEIFYEVNLNRYSSGKIDLEYLGDPQWELMCRAGILLFRDYYAGVNRPSLDVRIHNIDWLPVDTTNLLVLYACVEALSEAVGFPITGLSFDANNATFTFPEERNMRLLKH